MSTPTSGPRVSARHRKQKSPVVAIVLVVVGMIVLFAAGYGLSRVIQGSSSSVPSPTAAETTATSESSSATTEPKPCVTVTVTPGTGLPSTSQVTTNVYNATDRTGLAATTAEELQRRGFVIGTIDNDPLGKAVSGVAEIRHGPSGESAAKLMAFYLPGAVLVDDGRSDATIDTALGAAFTQVAPQSEVESAILEPSPSLSGPGCPSPSAPSAPAAPSSGEASLSPSPEASPSA